MPSLISSTVEQLLDSFASPEPLPGGGSASALAGAVGVSLLIKAATLRGTRSRAPERAADLDRCAETLRALRDILAASIDRDTEAYARLLQAFRAPRDTPEAQAQRRSAIATAIREATEVPLQVLRASRDALRHAVPVASGATPSAASDVRVGVELLLSAMRGASSSVASNLPEIQDPDYVGQTEDERKRLERESEEDAARARASL